MDGKRQILRRNQRMDAYKGIAVYAAICIHVLFPGSFGSAVRALGRFAFPFSFLTAGYFSLGASTVSLMRRAKRTGIQLLLCCLPYLVLGMILAALQGRRHLSLWLSSLRTLDAAENFILFHTIPLPYAWQLWFLGGLLFVYLLWWSIVVLADALGKPVPYDALAAAALVLLLIHLVFGEGYGLTGRALGSQILQNALFYGLPFFALGSWCAWRRHSLKALRLPWHRLILGVGLLSLAEAKLAGRQELYLGTLVLLAGIMGHCIRYRRISSRKLSAALRFCGEKLSLSIFAVHLLVLAAIREIPWLSTLNQLPWLLPILVAAVSTLIAMGLLWGKAKYLARRTAA